MAVQIVHNACLRSPTDSELSVGTKVEGNVRNAPMFGDIPWRWPAGIVGLVRLMTVVLSSDWLGWS